MHGTVKLVSGLEFSMNASHMKIKQNNKIIFQRTTGQFVPQEIEEKWYDADHKTLVTAVAALELAISEIADKVIK